MLIVEFRRAALLLLLASSLLSAGCDAWADALTSPLVATAKASGARSESATEVKRDGERAPTLRCWQYGRLIFEEAVSSPSSTAPGKSLSFNRPGEGRTPLELIDLGEAVCLLR